MSSTDTFVKESIKGKITEFIFQEMILDAGIYEPTPLGYEHTLPQLAHKDKINHRINEITTQLRQTPDFVLVEKSGDKVYLVEVKYRKKIYPDDIKSLAKKLCENWSHAWLFIATQEEFYMAYCKNIIKNDELPKSVLHEFGVTKENELKYLKYIQDFITT